MGPILSPSPLSWILTSLLWVILTRSVFVFSFSPNPEQRPFIFRSPEIPSVSNACRPAPAGAWSPYVECSPLKSGSPMRIVACRGSTLYHTSFLRLPSTPESSQEEQEEEAEALSADVPLQKAALHPLNGDAFAHGTHLVVAHVSISPDLSEGNPQGLTLVRELGSFKENHTVDMVDPEDMLDENSVKCSAGNNSMAVAGLNFEGSCICMSPLAESSASPCESSSLQVRLVAPYFMPCISLQAFKRGQAVILHRAAGCDERGCNRSLDVTR